MSDEEILPCSNLGRIYGGCGNCRTQKLKCNGQQPCARCRAFGLNCEVVLSDPLTHRPTAAAFAPSRGGGGGNPQPSRTIPVIDDPMDPVPGPI